MPGKIGLSCPSFAIRLSRNSSFTRRERNFSSEKGLRRNSPRVRGKLIAAQLQKLSAISRKQRRNVLIIRPRGSRLWAAGFGLGSPLKILREETLSLAEARISSLALTRR